MLSSVSSKRQGETNQRECLHQRVEAGLDEAQRHIGHVQENARQALEKTNQALDAKVMAHSKQLTNWQKSVESWQQALETRIQALEKQANKDSGLGERVTSLEALVQQQSLALQQCVQRCEVGSIKTEVKKELEEVE